METEYDVEVCMRLQPPDRSVASFQARSLYACQTSYKVREPQGSHTEQLTASQTLRSPSRARFANALGRRRPVRASRHAARPVRTHLLRHGDNELSAATPASLRRPLTRRDHGTDQVLAWPRRRLGPPCLRETRAGMEQCLCGVLITVPQLPPPSSSSPMRRRSSGSPTPRAARPTSHPSSLASSSAIPPHGRTRTSKDWKYYSIDAPPTAHAQGWQFAKARTGANDTIRGHARS